MGAFASPREVVAVERNRSRHLRVLGVSIMVVGGPLAVMVSFFVAYSIAGVAYFGPVLILFWASLVVGFVVIMEKSGKLDTSKGRSFPCSEVWLRFH